MVLLVQFVAIYAPWIYALCGLVALYHIYKTWQVRGERRQALFSLEREKAMRDLSNIFFVSLMLLVIMGVTYFSSEILPRSIQLEETFRPVATPTRIIIEFPPTAIPELPTPDTSAILTATLEAPTAAPVEAIEELIPDTPVPAAPVVAQPVAAPGCSEPGVQLTSPASGSTVSGQVDLSGTATHPQFQFYKFERAAGANAQGGFVYLVGGNSPVNNGLLGSFNSADLPNGAWTIQLVVVDVTGNFPAPCAITINVQN